MRYNKGVSIHTDQLAVHIWSTLLEDFKLPKIFSKAEECLHRRDLKGFRDNCVRECGIIPPSRFKRIQQMLNLLKKYRFENDVYTTQELEVRTNTKYLSNQQALCLNRFNSRTLRASLVLREARKVARSILGELSEDEVVSLTRFGKKSSIGCPLRQAYIDHKLTNRRAFTGSADVTRWFLTILEGDPILNRIVKRLRINPEHATLRQVFLVLENVPKTWKVHRSITPLALLDLFYTYGVGRVVQRRLKEHGLDIRHLQDRHRKWVKKFSLTCTHATADMSVASDSITIDLLNAILPRPWFNLVKFATTKQVMVGNTLCYTESVLPMGNGMTFPVETLVFYCIIKAIGNLAGVRGIYSVFGDDLVYPSRLHNYVYQVFPELGLTLNLEKTFVSFPFRESCGEDFYRGVAVRSFYLKNEESFTLQGARAEAFIYKTINGLLRRWDEHEIPMTLSYLLRQLTLLRFEVLRVPPTFPDTSGIKVDDPTHHLLGDFWIPYAPVKCYFSHGSRWFQFKFLRAIAKKRFIVDQEPYYWQKLAGDDDVVRTEFAREFSIYSEPPTQAVGWKRIVKKRFFRTKNGRLRKVSKVVYKPFVASRVVERFHLQENRRQSVSDWT